MFLFIFLFSVHAVLKVCCKSPFLDAGKNWSSENAKCTLYKLINSGSIIQICISKGPGFSHGRVPQLKIIMLLVTIYYSNSSLLKSLSYYSR